MVALLPLISIGLVTFLKAILTLLTVLSLRVMAGECTQDFVLLQLFLMSARLVVSDQEHREQAALVHYVELIDVFINSPYY